MAKHEFTKEQIALIEDNVNSFMKAAEEDPELYADALEKLGGPPLSEMALNTAKSIGTIALFAGAANAVGDLYDTAKDAINKSRNYKAMMDMNPALNEMDSTMVQRAFNTLHKFNPQYASDPTVAGEFVAQRARQQGLDFNQLKNIIDAGRATRPGRPSAMDYILNPNTIAGALKETASYPSGEEREAEMLRRRVSSADAFQTLKERAPQHDPLGEQYRPSMYWSEQSGTVPDPE